MDHDPEWNTGHIYRLLNNRIYIGEIAHKDRSYPGEHEGIIDRATWDKVQASLEDNKPVKISMARTKMVAPLKGVIRCGHCGCSMGPTYARKNVRHYTLHLPEGQRADREPMPAQTDSRRGHRAGGAGTGCSNRKSNSRWICRSRGSKPSNRFEPFPGPLTLRAHFQCIQIRCPADLSSLGASC